MNSIVRQNRRRRRNVSSNVQAKAGKPPLEVDLAPLPRDAVVAGPAALVCIGWRLLAMRRGWTAPRPAGASST